MKLKHSGKLILLSLIWLAVILQVLINRDLHHEEPIVEAFSSSEMIPVEGMISCYGEFGDMKLAKATKETMLINLAKKLGIMDGYEITDSEGLGYQETTLTKNGKYGDTTIQIVSMETENVLGESVTRQNILCDVKVYNDLNYTSECKDTLETIYTELGMKPSVNIYYKGRTEGMISKNRQDEITKTLLSILHAEEIERIENDNYTTIYAYTPRFEEHITQNGKDINVNLAYTYHESENMTYIHLAVPYIAQSY